LHLINGLFDANRSGVPVLAIASHTGWMLATQACI
jgi:thiamine pyrophosphate-dependent acetolactate synthase large subunit-like protein